MKPLIFTLLAVMVSGIPLVAPDIDEAVEDVVDRWIEDAFRRANESESPQQGNQGETLPEPESAPRPIGIDPIPPLPTPWPTEEPKQVLYYYTNDRGLAGIVTSQSILPSLADDLRAAFGQGQYFADISPIEAATVRDLVGTESQDRKSCQSPPRRIAAASFPIIAHLRPPPD